MGRRTHHAPEYEPGDFNRTAYPPPPDGKSYTGNCAVCGAPGSNAAPLRFGLCAAHDRDRHNRWWIRKVWADREQQNQRMRSFRPYGYAPEPFPRERAERIIAIMLPYLDDKSPRTRSDTGRALVNVIAYYRARNPDDGQGI